MRTTDFKKTGITIFSILINTLMFISISTLVFDWQFSRRIFMTTVVISLIFIVKNRRKLLLSKPEAWIFGGTFFYFLAGIASLYSTGSSQLGMERVFENHIFLLSIVPVALMLKNIKLRKKVFYSSLLILLIYSAIFAFLAMLNGERRPTIFSICNSNIFAIIVVTLTTLVLNYALIKKTNWTSWIVVITGIITLYYNESRISWITLVVVATSLLFMNFKSKKVRIILSILLVLMLLGVSQTKIVKNRFIQAAENIENYSEGEKKSSLGIRFEIYKLAIHFYKESPIFGIGPNGLFIKKFTDNYKELTPELKMSKSYQGKVFKHYHFHNEFLEELATKGSVGVISLILFLGSLISYFYKNLKNGIYASFGLVIIGSYMLSSLAEVTFVQNSLTLLFTIFISVIIAFVEQDKMGNL